LAVLSRDNAPVVGIIPLAPWERCPLKVRPFLIAFAVALPSVAAAPPDPTAEARELLRAKKYVEAAQKFEDYLATNRFDGRAWSGLSNCRHMAKQYERAIAAGQKAIACGYNPAGQMYDIACGYALWGKPDDALDWLKKGLDAGFADQETLENDSDLESIRKNARFVHLTGLNPSPDISVEERWKWDLDFLVRRMEQMHWSLYAKVPKETFLTEIRRLQADAPKLSADRARARLSRILALVGDGHTTLAAFAEGEKSVRRLPLHLYAFRDGLFVLGAPESRRELVGAKVLKVGPLEADDALAKVRPYCSVDNDMGYAAGTPLRLTQLGALQEIEAATGDDAEFTFRLRDGTTRSVRIAPEAVARPTVRISGYYRPGYIYANAESQNPRPLYQRDVQIPLTLETLGDVKAVYVGFHAVAENDGESFAAFVKRLMKRIEGEKAEYLVIDMRVNGGGNTDLVRPLIDALIRDDRINRPGHLFVIIGRSTFSAAQNTVNLLEANTHATFVGEPTGSRPNFVGESTYLVLPYSKLRVYCSSRYWQHGDSTDRRNWVPPQIAAELSCQDFLDNRDPCLEAILERIKDPGRKR
jgi:tetratricopeptide (TPR) repeat protein